MINATSKKPPPKQTLNYCGCMFDVTCSSMCKCNAVPYSLIQYDSCFVPGFHSRRIAQQMEENKKYEASLDDESGHVCVNNAEVAAPVNCQQGWKCCTSKRSYLSGVAHETQSKLKLYSICCQTDQHCKYDTIFVSCGPGAGPDDYSGVLAGLEEDATVETEEESADESQQLVVAGAEEQLD